jgi:hypothetical protein
MSANHANFEISQETIDKEFILKGRALDLEERRLDLQERDLVVRETALDREMNLAEWRKVAAEQTALMTEIRDLLAPGVSGDKP